MIEISDVGFRYGDEAPWTLRHVDASLPSGGGLLRLDGPNGAGKTTLMKLVLGLLTPCEGYVAGVVGRRLAAVFQEDRLIEHLTAIANVRLTARRRLTNAEISTELDAVGLDREAFVRPVSELSGGQRRRIALVRALLSQAEVVGLDEPLTGIDAPSLPAVMGYVRERVEGLDVVLITHDAEQAAFFGGTVVTLP